MRNKFQEEALKHLMSEVKTYDFTNDDMHLPLEKEVTNDRSASTDKVIDDTVKAVKNAIIAEISLRNVRTYSSNKEKRCITKMIEQKIIEVIDSISEELKS